MKKCMSLVCLMAACALFADTTPVMVSLVTPVQVPSHRYDVTGLRLSLIYGDCQGFAGLDLGIVGNSRMASRLRLRATLLQGDGNLPPRDAGGSCGRTSPHRLFQ